MLFKKETIPLILEFVYYNDSLRRKEDSNIIGTGKKTKQNQKKTREELTKFAKM